MKTMIANSLLHAGTPVINVTVSLLSQLGFFLGDEEDGQLVLGGVDDRHFEGKFHFVPVVTRSKS